ncbi:MAG TPA: hypothetical protein VM869_02395 [Enhygromyxa sp.]|nr:hypothetical protein [Enhygromyxa sp.]
MVRTADLDEAAFVAATRLRLPDLHLRSIERASEIEPACSEALHAYVEVRSEGAGQWSLALIFSDGRAWYRSVPAEQEDAARTLASALANLLAAIEDDQLDPDAEDVVLPIEAAPAPEPAPEPKLPSPAPPSPEPAEPELEPQPSSGPRERPIVLEVGPRLGLQSVVGIHPAAGYRATAGSLGLDLRTPNGLLIGLDVRVAGRSSAALSLLRTRVSLGVGYALRARRFELPIVLAAACEPWLVLEDGQRAAVDAPPLLGGGLRLAPGGLVELGRTTLRIAATLQLDATAELPSGRVPSVRLRPGSAPIFHVGGLELALGLELGLWMPVRQRS